MTYDAIDRRIRAALQGGIERAEVRSNDLHHLLKESQRDQVSGRWEGHGRFDATDGKQLNFLPAWSDLQMPEDVALGVTIRLTLDIDQVGDITGDGELDFDLRPVGQETIKSVYVDIRGIFRDDDHAIFELLDIETGNRFRFTGTLSTDGTTIESQSQDMTDSPFKEIYLEKIPDISQYTETITPQRKAVVLDLIRSARRFILVTHFTTEVHTEEYINLMLKKLQEGVTITRIVARHRNAPPKVYTWLNRFRDSEGNALPGYEEYRFPGATLPCDLMVVDDQVALQYFATYPDRSEFSFGLCHNHRPIARRFRQYLESLMTPSTETDAPLDPWSRIPSKGYCHT